MEAREFYLCLGEADLRCRRLLPAEGDAQGREKPIVFLHEALGCVEMWKSFPERLCERTGLPGLIYDRQGHGGSDPLRATRRKGYLEREARDVLPALLRALGIEHPVLFGHSDGGTIALLFAAAHPDWPCCAVTEAAHVFVEEITRRGIREAEATYRRTDLASRLAKYHGSKTADLFRAWAGTWLSEEFASWNMLAELPSIRCPLLAAQGEADEYGTSEQVERIVRDSSGPATPLFLSGCGHIPHLEAPDRVLDAAGEFIRTRYPS